MRLGSWAAGALGGILLVSSSACSGGEPNITSVTQDFCEALCGGWRRCGAGDSGCVSRCAANVSFEHTRLEGVEAVIDCLGGESCPTLLGNAPTSACFDAASDTLPPTTVAVQYCQGEAKKVFECGGWWGVEECTQTVSLWTDDVLVAAGACKELSACDDYYTCVETTFGAYQ